MNSIGYGLVQSVGASLGGVVALETLVYANKYAIIPIVEKGV